MGGVGEDASGMLSQPLSLSLSSLVRSACPLATGDGCTRMSLEGQSQSQSQSLSLTLSSLTHRLVPRSGGKHRAIIRPRTIPHDPSMCLFRSDTSEHCGARKTMVKTTQAQRKHGKLGAVPPRPRTSATVLPLGGLVEAPGSIAARCEKGSSVRAELDLGDGECMSWQADNLLPRFLGIVYAYDSMLRARSLASAGNKTAIWARGKR